MVTILVEGGICMGTFNESSNARVYTGGLAVDIEKIAQKIALKKELAAELEVKKEFFRLYLEHSFPLTSLGTYHQLLSNNIENNFDGQAKEALTNRFQENIREAHYLHYLFTSFLRHF